MQNIADIHTHILYGVDDGAKTIDDSIELLKEEIKQGVSLIFFTPHFYYGHNYYDVNTLKERYSLIEENFKKFGN